MTVADVERWQQELFALVGHYNALGSLLPKPNHFEVGDAAARAEVKVILKEMTHVQAKIDAMLERGRN